MTTATQAQPAGDAHSDVDHHHDHPSYVAHHFESAEQQFDAGKLGMWLFLITEILFFSGLFVAYTIYRTMHPEIFEYAHQFLNKSLGAINTGVLLFSSLTMAWAVRCAQLGQRWGLVNLLAITLFCAALFLGVKTFEYTEKIEKRLLWTGAFVTATDLGKEARSEGAEASHLLHVSMESDPKTLDARVEEDLKYVSIFWYWSLMIPLGMTLFGHWMNQRNLRSTGIAGLIAIVGITAGIQIGLIIHHASEGHGHEVAGHTGSHEEGEHDAHVSSDPHLNESGEGPGELATEVVAEQHEDPKTSQTSEMAMVKGDPTNSQINAFEQKEEIPRNATVFFSIYYFMTGLHAIHIIGGMIAITWLLVRAVNNEFHGQYFGPVDYVGLYWHLVDLIWIYLFPLLYLIH